MIFSISFHHKSVGRKTIERGCALSGGVGIVLPEQHPSAIFLPMFTKIINLISGYNLTEFEIIW